MTNRIDDMDGMICDEQAKEIISVMRGYVKSSPLPDASEFKLYNDTLEGAANRILSMAEKEMQERHKRELEIVKTDNFISKGGLFLGFICFIFPMILSVFLALKGKETIAGVMLGASVLSVIPSFLKVIRKDR